MASFFSRDREIARREEIALAPIVIDWLTKAATTREFNQHGTLWMALSSRFDRNDDDDARLCTLPKEEIERVLDVMLEVYCLASPSFADDQQVFPEGVQSVCPCVFAT